MEIMALNVSLFIKHCQDCQNCVDHSCEIEKSGTIVLIMVIIIVLQLHL